MACKQLGFEHGAAAFTRGSAFGSIYARAYLGSLRCTGGENTIQECPGLNEDYGCGTDESAGVICKSKSTYSSTYSSTLLNCQLFRGR